MIKAKEITKENAQDLILKIKGKTKIKGGKTQINTLNGFNIILTDSEAKKYKLGDTIIYNTKENKITATRSKTRNMR